MARRAAREEGMLVGISSGATLAAIAQKLPSLPPGCRVLGFNYDTRRTVSVDRRIPADGVTDRAVRGPSTHVRLSGRSALRPESA